MLSVVTRLDQGKSILSYHRARKWELNDGAEDGYADADMELSSDSETNLPLATISSGYRTTTIPAGQPKLSTQGKLTSGGNCFRKNNK